MDFVDCLVHNALFFALCDPGAVPFSCLSHTGPPDCSGPFLSHSCLSNTPPTADMSSSSRDGPNTSGKECKADLSFLLLFLHRKSKSSCSALSLGPKVFLLNSFCVHTRVWLCLWVSEWMNMPEFVLGYQAMQYRPVCRLQWCCPSWTVPAQSMDALSFPIISSPLHSMPSLYSCLGFSAFFWSVSEDFCLNDPLRTTGPSFVMTSSLIWVNELNMSLYPNQISCGIIHPSRSELLFICAVWVSGPGQPQHLRMKVAPKTLSCCPVPSS